MDSTMHPQDITPRHCGLGSQGSPLLHVVTTTSGLESSTPFPRTPAPQAIQDPVGSFDIHPTSQVTPRSTLCCTVGRPSVTPIFPQRGPHLSSSYRGSPGLVPSLLGHTPLTSGSPAFPFSFRKPLYPTFFDDPLSGPLIQPHHSESVTSAYLWAPPTFH